MIPNWQGQEQITWWDMRQLFVTAYLQVATMVGPSRKVSGAG
jgi:hypothetical protein